MRVRSLSHLLLSSLFVVGISVSSTATASIKSELLQCASIGDKLDRLICYDKLSRAVKGKNAVPAPIAKAPVAAPAVTKDNFGLKAKPKADQLDKIYLIVQKVTRTPHGALKITFKNGQVWKQTDGRHFKVKIGDRIFIKTGALGSYLLGRDGQNSQIRVKRLN